MAFIEVDEDNFTAILEQEFEKKQIVILKFGSEYCEPCHALECELEEVDDEFEDVSVLNIDTDESPSLAEQFDVFQLPTMLIYTSRETLLYKGEGVVLAQDINAFIGK
jgi:thioredoxin 1